MSVDHLNLIIFCQSLYKITSRKKNWNAIIFPVPHFERICPNPWISVPNVVIPWRRQNKNQDVGAQPHFAHIKGEKSGADGIKIEI
jgi:hypothetical protein